MDVIREFVLPNKKIQTWYQAWGKTWNELLKYILKKKTFGFLFPGGIKRDQWHEMG